MKYTRLIVVCVVALAMLVVLMPQKKADAAGAFCPPVAVGTTSVSLLAAGTVARSWMRVCNAGPSSAYICEGQGATSCTASLGTLLGIGCLPDYTVHLNTNGGNVSVPTDDFEAITLFGTANVSVCAQ